MKCMIAIPGIKKDHPKEKIEVWFAEWTLDLIVWDWGSAKPEVLHFGVRKLHCKVIPEECKWDLKDGEVVITLKKFKQTDNWWSFFKQKATGEVDSEED